jgi:Flp pilus assembly pilin Flp
MHPNNTGKSPGRQRQSGQALVEYALILVLVAVALGVALALTGPAIGNVFSNTVYNLVSAEDIDPNNLVDLQARNGEESFWLTVTWVANNALGETPQPPNPPRPPTSTYTPGPSPTSTPVTPSLTPTQTPTEGPSATPTDYAFVAPWYDPVDDTGWWRLDNSVFLSGDDWFGEYFANPNLTGTPDQTFFNQALGSRFNLNFNWGNNGPISNWNNDNFSVRYTRPIYIRPDLNPTGMEVRFILDADDSASLVLMDQTGTTVTQTIFGSGGGSRQNVITIPPGFHRLVVEYREYSGAARVSLSASRRGSINPDDQSTNGGAVNCNWGKRENQNVNSLRWMFEENLDGEFPSNMICYLELRGFVSLAQLPNGSIPHLAFWDVWDLTGGGASTWVEVAQYSEDRTALNWQRINLRSGGANYNWTRNVVNLANYGFNTGTNNRVAIRFGMQAGGGGGTRRWYVDDIEVRSFQTETNTFGVCTGSQATCRSYWHFDAAGQLNDFITTERWELTNTNARGASGLDDSPNVNYNRHTEGGPRIHYVELNGRVDFTGIPNNGIGGTPDYEGDEGFPRLTFWQAFALGSGSRLELQYTRDPFDTTPDTWSTIKVLGTAGQTNMTLSLQEIVIDGSVIPNWNTQPFRLRFAMILDAGAAETDGWWIDELLIDRVGVPRYTQYPFCDGADTATSNCPDSDGTTGNWLMEGQWGLTNTSASFNTPASFTDSPGRNYTHGTNASMQLRYPIDLRNNTPANLDIANNPLGGNRGGAANRPMLTFWHWRDLARTETLRVEWSNNRGATWNSLWSYTYSTRTGVQRSWERVVIDLGPMMNSLPTNATPETWDDDDVFLRFRLDARSDAAVSDGVYIDEVRVQNYSETVHRLWETADGDTYTDDIDSPAAWWLRWYAGGNWSATDFGSSAHSGLRSMHDSGSAGINYRHQTYSVLEMQRIIDLRSVSASNNPTLYFWTRYDIGDNDSIRVQVSEEDGSTSQGYDKILGWSAWTDLVGDSRFAGTAGSAFVGSNSRLDTWTRVQMSLNGYAGDRIRVRFVLDAYENSNNLRDGWFVDDVVFTHRNPRIYTIPFYDPAQNMQNWVAEGSWGLSPDVWRGSGGGPASLGFEPWYGYYFNCNGCSPSSADTLLRGIENSPPLDNRPNGNEARKNYPTTAGGEVIYLDISKDLGSRDRGDGRSDNYVARFRRNVTIQSGEFSFITVSDDGVRLKIEPSTLPSLPGGSVCTGWNIICNWSYHGRTVDIATVTLPAGDFLLTLEYFEGTGDAVIIMSAGKNNFSFSDSPRLGANRTTFPPVLSTRYGNSALILNGVLDLRNPNPALPYRPVIEYYTFYDLPTAGINARVEVSADGGFSWTQNNLSSGIPSSIRSDPTIGGYAQWVRPDMIPGGSATDWQRRQHNLTSYVGVNSFLGLRFRLDTRGAGNGTMGDGWWLVDIRVDLS